MKCEDSWAPANDGEAQRLRKPVFNMGPVGEQIKQHGTYL